MNLLLSAAGVLAAFALGVLLIALGAWLWMDTDRIADELIAEADRGVAS